MPLLQRMVSAAAGRMPKTITPSTHALIDYAMAGSFLLAGAVYWRRNKRAAMSAFVCGGVAAAAEVSTVPAPGIANHDRMSSTLRRCSSSSCVTSQPA